MRSVLLLENATVPGIGEKEHPNGPCSYQASVSGSGLVSAVVEIQVSNDDDNWMWLGTISINGTDSATDGFPCEKHYAIARAELISISGTGAAVNAAIGA